MRRVISLSTIPPRFATVGPTLRSLLAQRGRIDEIRLHVPRAYRRFPDYDGAVPDVPDGVTIVRPDRDLGPATKVLFTAEALRGTRTQILFCDDDRLFHADWAEELFEAQAARPDECVALIGKPIPDRREARAPRARIRRHVNVDYPLRRLGQEIGRRLGRPTGLRETRRPVARAGYADILQGFGGAVVRPEFLDDEAFDIPPVLWAVDDVWLSGMLERRGVPIWLPADLRRPPTSAAASIAALYDATIEGAARDEANARCVRDLRARYGIWR